VIRTTENNLRVGDLLTWDSPTFGRMFGIFTGKIVTISTDTDPMDAAEVICSNVIIQRGNYMPVLLEDIRGHYRFDPFNSTSAESRFVDTNLTRIRRFAHVDFYSTSTPVFYYRDVYGNLIER